MNGNCLSYTSWDSNLPKKGAQAHILLSNKFVSALAKIISITSRKVRNKIFNSEVTI